MSDATVRLQLHFELELAAPPDLAGLDHAALCRTLSEALGPTVLRGLPVIAGKQLTPLGARVLRHHHRLDAAAQAARSIAREQVTQVAPHLTDTEADTLAQRAAARLPAAESEQAAYLRSQALALVNEYRLVPCVVEALLTSGKPARIESKLNLTNGHIFLDASHRQTRLQAGQGALRVSVADTPVVLAAECSGHTLTGPVLDVAVGSLVPHRDVLLARWQAG